MELLILVICAFSIIQDVSAYPTKGNPYKSEHCIKMTPQKEQEINKIIAIISEFLGNMTEEFGDYDIRLIKLDIESHSEDEVEEKDVQLQLTVNDCAENIGEDEHDTHKSEESDNSGEKQEKDIIIDIPEESKKNDEHIETTTQISNTTEQTEGTTESNDMKRCEKCPCVCNSGTQNVELTTSTEQGNRNNEDTDNNEINTIETKADTNGYEDNTIKTNQNTTKTVNHYEVTPVDTIRFYDFGENTDSNNNDGGNKQPEITEIYTFSKEVKPEVITLDLSGVEGDVLELLGKRNNKPLVVFIQKNIDQNEYIFL